MDKKTKIEVLLKVADLLDRQGDFGLADSVDEIVKSESTNEQVSFDAEIPEDEYQLLSQLYEALGMSLK